MATDRPALVPGLWLYVFHQPRPMLAIVEIDERQMGRELARCEAIDQWTSAIRMAFPIGMFIGSGQFFCRIKSLSTLLEVPKDGQPTGV